MTEFLNLPPELRYMIYDYALESILARPVRTIWPQEVLKADIYVPRTIAVPRRRLLGSRRPLSVMLDREDPVVYIRDIAPLVSLART